jgi:lysophospholipase L1-like esterase
MGNLGCPDIIFIFGGTNDAWAGSPIGEYQYEGWTKEKLYSFRPAMAKMLSFMIDRYPNVEIYFILNDGLQEEINESVKTVCEHYQIPCIVLNGIDKANGHPTIKGMTQIYEQVESFLSR